MEASTWIGRPHIGLDAWSPNININRWRSRTVYAYTYVLLVKKPLALLDLRVGSPASLLVY